MPERLSAMCTRTSKEYTYLQHFLQQHTQACVPDPCYVCGTDPLGVP